MKFNQTKMAGDRRRDEATEKSPGPPENGRWAEDSWKEVIRESPQGRDVEVTTF